MNDINITTLEKIKTIIKKSCLTLSVTECEDMDCSRCNKQTPLNTGLRRTNIIQLKWSNINLDFRIIELLENKGNKHIKLPINDKLMEVFNSLDKTSEYVFINPDTNKPYSQTVFTRLWNDIRTKAGLGGDFRFHDLRHTVGTRLAEKRVPVNIIKEVMAHTDISTTQRYIHFAENQLTSAMDVLNSYN